MNGENEPSGDKGIPDAFWVMVICVALVVLPLLAIATESKLIFDTVSILVIISIVLTIYYLTKRRNE